jgi:hypothetical protein
MNIDTQLITKATLGFVMGISVGLLFRYFLFRILLFISFPIIAMLIIDYTGTFSVDWLFLKSKWDKTFVFLTPTAISIYFYLSNHILIGLIPGIIIGLTSGFLFMRR